MRRCLTSRLGLAFFTLPPDYSVSLHTQIWELIQFGNGFTWLDVYSLPTYLRNFYFNKLIELKKEEKKQNDELKSKVRFRKK